MTQHEQLRNDLAAVLALAGKATPGPWFSDQHCPCNEGRENDPDVSLWGSDGMTEEFICNIAFDWSRADDAEACAAAINFFRTHGARLTAILNADADLAQDAARYRWLRDHAVFGSMASRDNSLALNCDEPASAWDEAIDAAMRQGGR